MTVFPPRNLPGGSVPWARAVENRIDAAKKSRESVSASLGNLERGTSGQLAQMSSLVDRLLLKSTETISVPSMSVTGNATSTPFPTTTNTVVFPAVNGHYTGFLTINGFISNTVPVNNVVFVRVNGQLVIRKSQLPSGNAASDPVESQGVGYLSAFTRIDVPGGADLSVSVEFTRGANGTTSTSTFYGIQLSLTRS